jgi:flagellar export protein FliJ
MKQFHFKLESVLQLRERAETEAQQVHAAAGRRLETALSELNEAEAECKQLGAQLAQMQVSTFRPAEREILWNALKYQQDHCIQLTQKADNARRDVEDKLQRLLSARQDHEEMVTLMEKERHEHARLAEQEEWAMIDDIVNARHTATRKNEQTGNKS